MYQAETKTVMGEAVPHNLPEDVEDCIRRGSDPNHISQKHDLVI